MLKSAIFTLIEGLARTARASYHNGHLSRSQERAFARALTRFQLGSKIGGGQFRVDPFVFNYPDPKAFAYNFGEVFLDEEYFFLADSGAPVIVDCGANIGLATLYFKLVYPKSKIVAIEANPATFETLVKNVSDNHLADVEPLNVAVTGGDETEVALTFAEAGDLRSTRMKELHGRSVTEVKQVIVPAKRLSSLFPPSIDLLKMDIEGSEHDVIDDIVPYLTQVKNVIVEYHYAFGGERRSLGEFITLLESAGFICRIKSANPADLNFDPKANYVVTIYGSRPTQTTSGI